MIFKYSSYQKCEAANGSVSKNIGDDNCTISMAANAGSNRSLELAVPPPFSLFSQNEKQQSRQC